MKQLIQIFLILFFLCSCHGQNHRLPNPSGSYKTGVTYLSFFDAGRKELFDDEHIRNREITIKVWYPADDKTDYEYYLENPDYIIKNFQFPDSYRTLKTNSCRDVPVSKARKSFAVIIFSHGWGEHFSQNTILMEELASQGYIVFSIAHHYECKFSFYPDGRIVILNMKSNRFNQIMQEQQNPSAVNVFQKMVVAETDKERLAIFKETNTLLPTLMTGSSVYWAEDIAYLIDQLDEINKENSIFKTRLDLDRIGVMGMSMGGIATNEICLRDKRVKAGVNIDGAIYGSLTDTVMNTPFLFLNSQRYLGYGNLFLSKNKKDCFSVTVKNSDHYNFSDYALFPVRNQTQIGKVDAKIPIEIMNLMICDFFDRYLFEDNTFDLKDYSKKYDVEVEFQYQER